ncbi:NADP-dependent glutamate dehydrogenase [Yamadazyma tenuis]|uniref:Glutamate dehydrogenase n=1 Tax=Candida tenuis (strain ATCC 10573 / BCRC 21748 / CBS 615 / JCM 9827 / NBRC 10315 / NRRL Y-1498 / VKM Y-70) TaxID=590646 RepID=G3B1S1_CANTC|nr:NADP-glutamate dehydrogenase [Yamadazyma tenuis ATCC 10573]EGV64517.1 NADP-glutamate dehydrogenase [Yamadazyma tenuis ATCC 10573]WEJ97281.1 NADP-dependent glutamate dehydrogenase [Yamadazyma tenuis]
MVLPHEPEFQQAYNELVSALQDSTLFEEHPKYKKVIPVVSVPERLIQFRVAWENDKGEIEVNNGFRVQFNSALGPYKGGLRFHPSVNLSILKFLGFEQIFKNALTGLSMGGGKGGCDFNPKGRTDAEIRRFCVAFMRQLARYIGQDTDVPAGDIGVGGREIGFLFGAYKQMQNNWSGILTGKGLSWGGSLIRPEATGYGVVYYVEKMIEKATNGKETFKGKRVAISGSGNVAQYAALKVIELGGIVVSLSDSKGAIISKNGITPEQVEAIADAKIKFKSLEEIIGESVSAFSGSNSVEYKAGARPWVHAGAVDIALPSATQNEVSAEEAKALIAAGCKFIAEGSNMGSTAEAIDVFEESRSKNVWYAPGKAANCGGVAVSGLEMAQNSQRVSWTREEVDQKLKDIMYTCFDNCYETAKKYSKDTTELPSLLKGANIAGFLKVADAMFDQGDVF